MLYANMTNHPISIATGPAHFDFPVGAYYNDVAELAPYNITGWLSSVVDTYPTTNPTAVQATRRVSYTAEASNATPLVPERWIGLDPAPTATHFAVLDTLAGFDAVSALNAYGAATQVLGSDDTPIVADMGSFTITGAFLSSAIGTGGSLSRIRIAYGNGTYAQAITAGQFTEFVITATPGIFPVSVPKLPAGTNLWVASWNVNALAALTFLFGIREM